MISFRQWFGPATWSTLLGSLGALLLAVPVEGHPVGQLVVLALLALLGALLFVTRPVVAWVFVFAELFGFSHGKLFEATVGGFPLTSRMAIFLGVMGAWGVLWVWKKRRVSIHPTLFSVWTLCAGAVLAGFLAGGFANGWLVAFHDANGYLYAAYLLPLLSHDWNREDRRVLLQGMVGSALWISGLSVGVLYLFTHLPGEALVEVYRFLRDARIGEMTLMDGGYWRVFFQSQIVLLPVLFLTAAYDVEADERMVGSWWLTGLQSVLLAGFIVSLSRSFWLGGVAGAFLLLWGIWRASWVRRLVKPVGRLMLSGIGAVILLVVAALLSVPFPSKVSDLQQTFAARTTDAGDLAVSSRWNLLPVMLQSMWTAPPWGHGFGTELAFVSDDPRVRAIYPDGRWRTYSFEWGWLDIWVKMGMIGFFAFVALFVAYERLLRLVELFWVRMGLRATLLMLVTAHVFSPYLNHPLGIGLLLFVTIWLPEQELKKELQANKNRQEVSSILSVSAPVVSSQERSGA